MDGAVFSESLPLADLLVRSAQRTPQHPAVVFPDHTITYGQLLADSVEVARGLRGLGVGPGDKVGVLMPNCPEVVSAIFGTALLGAVLVPLNARHKSAELAYIVDHAELSVLLTTDAFAARTDYRAVLTSAFPDLSACDPAQPLDVATAKNLNHAVMLRGVAGHGLMGEREFGEIASRIKSTDIEEIRCRVRVRDIAMLLYTSGTTAHPKGCLITHEAASRGPVGRTAAAIPFDEPVAERVMWCPAPLFHIAAFQGLVSSIAQGATFLTDTNVDGARALREIKKWRATSLWPMFMPPLNAITELHDFRADDLAHVSSIVTVGTAPELRALQERFPKAVLVNGSGMSEMTGHFCLSARDDSAELRATTSGRLVAGVEGRVIDPTTGQDRPDGELGELLLRGYSMMSGYYRQPEVTAKTIDGEGWLHTGDLFRRLPSGHFRYEGRLKDMLKVGGENVPPIEIEEFLCAHPAVASVHVVGRPDDKLDEVAVAFVELKDGASVGAADLIDYCVGQIASFKVPRAVHIVAPDEWPMSATKVSKVALRQWAADLADG
jgi:fatty-acyl-CoA synthase/long-chain acyl-CoA synthetase